MRDLLPNSHAAIVLGEIARDAGPAVHRAVHLGVFDAYYGRGLDIGDRAVLLEVAERAGLARGVVEAGWRDPTYEKRVHALRHLAVALGVSATPSALVCDTLIVGTRPPAVIAATVEECLSRAREGA